MIMPENLCCLCGHHWKGDPLISCPKCGEKDRLPPPKARKRAAIWGGGTCDLCGCEFNTPLSQDNYCPNCGTTKWNDGKPRPKMRPSYVWSREIIKTTKEGSKTYTYWMATWREGGKTRNVHLGSSKRLSKQEALEKARKVKTDALKKLQT